MVFPSGTHLTVESTEAMLINGLAKEHHILTQPGFQPSIAVCRIRHDQYALESAEYSLSRHTQRRLLTMLQLFCSYDVFGFVVLILWLEYMHCQIMVLMD